jgi:hypothetical protein
MCVPGDLYLLLCLQDVNISLFEAHIRGGQPMAALGAGGTRQVAALPTSLHAHAATAAVSNCLTQSAAEQQTTSDHVDDSTHHAQHRCLQACRQLCL